MPGGRGGWCRERTFGRPGLYAAYALESLSGKRSWREDHIQMCSFYQGITSHENSYDFVTINPVEVVSTKQAMKPAGAKLMDWIAGWKI